MGTKLCPTKEEVNLLYKCPEIFLGIFLSNKYRMNYYKIYTLVDITRSGQYRNEPDKQKEKHQQQNFDMLLQTIGMRANPEYENIPSSFLDNVKNYGFGSLFRGEHRIWEFDFYIEREDSLKDETGNPCGFLIKDLDLIPMITGLSETASMKTAVFNTSCNKLRNVIISPILNKY